jgi:hypothetical protein
MFNASDYILDEKVRKAAAHYPALYLIPEWKQLEEKLDIELPVKKKRRRLIIFWLLFAGLLTGASYIIYYGNAPQSGAKETSDVVLANSNSKTKSVSGEITNAIPGQSIHHDSSTKNLTQIDNAIDNAKNIITDKSLNNKLTDSKNDNELITTTANKKNLPVYEETVIEQKRNKQNRQTFLRVKKSDTIEKSNQTETKLNTITAGTFSMENKVSVYNGVDTNTAINIKIRDSIALASKFIDSNAISDNKIAREKTVKKNSSRFSITALGGTNLNSVQFNNPSKAGLDYGILAGYRISPKFEVRTGLIFSKKYFTTTGNNISFDSAKLNLPSYNSINLEDATGYCRFMEVPLMLYYQFSSKRKINFYAAGGFSINKMRMESIHYTFLADGNTIVERSHTSARHNKSDFSTSVTANFSIGIKYNLNSRWNISAEPYLRLPLTRFNNNNLRFSTFGTMLSLTYNLPGSKKK